MLARAAARTRELAIRCALGAGRRRLVRQLLTESVLLACAGGVGGVAARVLGHERPVADPARTTCERCRCGPSIGIGHRPHGAGVHRRRSRWPAESCSVLRRRWRRSGRTSLSALKDSAPGATGGKSRLRYALVAAEVALTLVVLAGAGVMLLSVSRLLRVDPGLDPSNVLVHADVAAAGEPLLRSSRTTRDSVKRWIGRSAACRACSRRARSRICRCPAPTPAAPSRSRGSPIPARRTSPAPPTASRARTCCARSA